MFDMEAKGLTLLRRANTVAIPEVIGNATSESYQLIVLEFIESSGRSEGFWEDLGYQLGALHKNTAPTFGLDHDNYMGSLPQLNTQTSHWPDFFMEQRLQVQLKLAINAHKIEVTVANKFEALY